MNNVVIRPFSAFDCDRWQCLYPESAECSESLERIFDAASTASPEILCYVAETDSKLIGVVFGYATPEHILLPRFLYVHPSYRKRGIGKLLNDKLEEESKECGCRYSEIYYNKFKLHSFHAKNGYVVGESIEIAYKDLK